MAGVISTGSAPRSLLSEGPAARYSAEPQDSSLPLVDSKLRVAAPPPTPVQRPAWSKKEFAFKSSSSY